MNAEEPSRTTRALGHFASRSRHVWRDGPGSLAMMRLGRQTPPGTDRAARNAMHRVVVFGLAVTIAGACSAARLPAPAYVGQPTAALQEVAYPPPPARVEFVPASPNSSAVWLDGEWTWQGQRWAWKQGRWVTPPANASYSPWTAARDKEGTYYVAEGKWRDKQGREMPDPVPLAVGRTRGGPVVNPEGEEVPSAPNVPPQTQREAPSTAGGGDAGGPETPSGATPTGTLPKTGPILDAGAD